MRLAKDIAALRAELAGALRSGQSIGLVPTMGALHAGHLSLVARSVAADDVTVVSVFVNPLQFGPGEDLAAYPRDLGGDQRILERAGTRPGDVLFAPSAAELTPPERRTTVHVAGLTEHLEGATRPGHFDGVATIVTKLFALVRPDRAYFGEKDYQQLQVVRALTRDLDLGVEVVGCEIVRDDDGVALSSRNTYLTDTERAQARALSAALAATAEAWTGDADAARRHLRDTLRVAPGVRLDYAEVVDPETLDVLEGVTDGAARAVVAAWVGTTRLIDTHRLEPRPAA